MKEVLIPEIAKDLGVTPNNFEPRLLAAIIGAVVDAYHSDDELAKMEPLQFIERTFNMLESIINKKGMK